MARDDNPKKEIKTDEIANRLVREKQGLIRLKGLYLGNSEREGYYRLYYTQQMDCYLEFSKEGTVDAERFPSGGLVVWLKAGTSVVAVTSRSVSDDFLRGSIAESYGRRARGIPGAVYSVMAAAGDGCGYSAWIPANCPDTKTGHTCQPTPTDPNCPPF